jgi:hypothetical protein
MVKKYSWGTDFGNDVLVYLERHYWGTDFSNDVMVHLETPLSK